MVKADVSKYTFNFHFRNMTRSFWKSYIEQQTISQIKPGASVKPMSSSRQFETALTHPKSSLRKYYKTDKNRNQL